MNSWMNCSKNKQIFLQKRKWEKWFVHSLYIPPLTMWHDKSVYSTIVYIHIDRDVTISENPIPNIEKNLQKNLVLFYVSFCYLCALLVTHRWMLVLFRWWKWKMKFNIEFEKSTEQLLEPNLEQIDEFTNKMRAKTNFLLKNSIF